MSFFRPDMARCVMCGERRREEVRVLCSNGRAVGRRRVSKLCSSLSAFFHPDAPESPTPRPPQIELLKLPILMPPFTGLTVIAPSGQGDTRTLHPSACEGFPARPAPSFPPPPSPRTLRTATALAQVIGVLWTQVLTVFGRAEAEEAEGEEEVEEAVQVAEAGAAHNALAPEPTSASLAAAYRCAALPLPPPSSEGRLTVSSLGRRGGTKGG